MAYTTWCGTEWNRVDLGHYIREDGAEIVKTGAATWTLTLDLGHHLAESKHRSLRKAMNYADTV